MELSARHRQLARQFGDGAFCPASNRGLAKLRRRLGTEWTEVVWSATPHRTFAPTTTLTQALNSDLFKSAMPRHPDDAKRIERERRLGAHLVADGAVGELGEVDEAALSSLLSRLVETGMYADPARRAVSIARRLAVDWAHALGVEPRVDDAPRGGGRRLGKRRARPVPSLVEVAELVQRADRETVQFIALVLGAGLREQQALGVRVGDLRADGLLQLRDPHEGFVVGELQLPSWTVGLLPTSPALSSFPSGAFLFPHRLDAQRHRLSFGERLRGLSRPGQPMTSSALRRLNQAVLRAARLPRELVRGSWMAEGRGRGRPPWWGAYARLQQAWTVLVHPPVQLPDRLRVPRRSRAAGALDPDIGAGRASTRSPLPAAVHPGAPPPARPPSASPGAGIPQQSPVGQPGIRSARRHRGRAEGPTLNPSKAPPPARRGRLALAPVEAETSPPNPGLDRRLNALEVGERKAGAERRAILDEVRRLSRSQPPPRGSGATPFVAGAVSGAALTLLLQRPKLLRQAQLDPTRLNAVMNEVSRELEGLPEPAPSEAPMMFSYIDPPAPTD